MNLHRTTGRPDWLTVPSDKRNFWQRLAADTSGVITPANFVTLMGFLLVFYGLIQLIAGDYLVALVILVVGRLLDIADGWLADVTGTKSPVGEALDAGLDKVGTVFTLVVFWVAAVAPAWLLIGLLLPQVIISLITFFHVGQRRKVHPSRLGKYSMALAWVALGGLLAAKAFEAPPTGLLVIAVYAVALVSLGMGLYAAAGYVKRPA